MSEEDSIGWEWMKNRTPAEPVAKEPGLKCSHCGTTYPGVNPPCPNCGKKTAQKLVRLPTPAAQPTGELGTCQSGREGHSFEHLFDPTECMCWQPRTPQPVTGAPDWKTYQQANCPKCGERITIEVLGGAFPSPAGTRERAERAAKDIQELHDVRLISCGRECLTCRGKLADIVERAWAGEGKNAD